MPLVSFNLTSAWGGCAVIIRWGKGSSESVVTGPRKWRGVSECSIHAVWTIGCQNARPCAPSFFPIESLFGINSQAWDEGPEDLEVLTGQVLTLVHCLSCRSACLQLPEDAREVGDGCCREPRARVLSCWAVHLSEDPCKTLTFASLPAVFGVGPVGPVKLLG